MGNSYVVNMVDTDAVMFSKSNGDPFSDSEQVFLLEELNSLFPKTIHWEHDGVYDTVVILKTKNYVLKSNGKVKLKGSSLVDQKKEPALAEMLKVMLADIMDNKGNHLEQIYEKYVKEAIAINDISRWCVKKTVTKSVLAGDDEEARTNESKVLDAMNEGQADGGYQEGDKIFLYNALAGSVQKVAKGERVTFKDGSPKMIPNCILRLKELFDGDYDTAHYLKRVYSTAAILCNVVDVDRFTNYSKKSELKLLGLTSDEI